MLSWARKQSSGVDADQRLAEAIETSTPDLKASLASRSAEGMNYALALGSFSILAYALVYWRLGLMLGVKINLCSAALCLFSAVTIHTRLYVYVRHLAMFAVNAQLLCLVMLVLGTAPGAQYFLIAIAADIIEVLCVKLPVQQASFYSDGLSDVSRNCKSVVNSLSGSWRDLMAVKRRKDILSISTIDSFPFTIENERIHEM